jgi:Ku protein
MPRAIWKGAIAFGLVHVPVALYPASEESEIDFDWLDKRSMDPVGYKRVNKRTGTEIHKDDVVKGVKQASGDYVILSEDEIKAAYPKTTQTIESRPSFRRRTSPSSTWSVRITSNPSVAPTRPTRCCARRWPRRR